MAGRVGRDAAGLQHAGVGVVLVGKQYPPAAGVDVVGGRGAWVPAVACELAVGGLEEDVALVLVLADEQHPGLGAAVEIARVAPPPAQKSVIAAELLEVLVDAAGAVVLDEKVRLPRPSRRVNSSTSSGRSCLALASLRSAAAAERKRTEATQRAEAALADLVRTGQPVTFRGLTKAGGVSVDFLYRPPLRARIEELRAARQPARTEPTANDAGGESPVARALAAQLRELTRRHREELADLRRALAVAQGENLELRRRLGRPTPSAPQSPQPRRDTPACRPREQGA